MRRVMRWLADGLPLSLLVDLAVAELSGERGFAAGNPAPALAPARGRARPAYPC